VNRNPNRRQFITETGKILSKSWLTLHLPVIMATAQYACEAKKVGMEFETLTSEEATQIEAIAAQIIPSDDTPGAKEAGVVYFIDRALSTFMARGKESILQGLTTFNKSITETHGAGQFTELTNEQQIGALKKVEETPFFQQVRFLTVAGFFSHPDYGGNKQKMGWQLLGFIDHHAWQPPFGYYDKNYSSQISG